MPEKGLTVNVDDEKDQEKRQYPRIEANAYLDYNTSDKVLLFHAIENISLGGVSISAPLVEEVGSIVEMSINFPEEDEVVELRGEVVWARIEEHAKMGIKFIDVSDEVREKLKTLLAKTNRVYSAI